MNLKYKWYLRQDVLRFLANILSATFIVTMLIVIRYEKFLHYGLGMYPNITLPRGGVSLIQAIQYFDKTSIEPLVLIWLPIALVLDIVAIRPLVRKWAK